MLHISLYDARGVRWLWLGTWLVALLLATIGLAHGQAAAPFTIGVTPAGPVTLGAGQQQVLTAAAVYPGFAGGTGFNAAVSAIAVQADGKLLVSGSFTQYGPDTRYYVARLKLDGTLDASFGSTSATASLNGSVTALAVQADGKILVGGIFTYFGSAATPRRYVARLNADGSLDPSFVPQGTQNGNGLDGNVAALAVQADGKILVGGSFKHFDGNGSGNNGIRCPGLARLTTGGSLDKGFVPDYDSTSTAVLCLAIQPDGKILVGGSADNAASGPFVTLSTLRNYIARLNPNGSLDAPFVPHYVSLNPKPLSTTVRAILVQPDGKILLGGSTGQSGVGLLSFVRRLSPAGTDDPGFTKYGPSGLVATALGLQADGKLLVGLSGGGPSLVRLKPDGTTDGFSATNLSPTTPVTALALQANGQLVVGSTYLNPNSSASPAYIARLSALDGTLATASVAVLGATYAWSNGSTGASLTVAASGTYAATATAAGVTATSNAVVVTGTVAPFTVRITPTGPFNICPGTTQAVTAAVQGTTQAATYTWWKVGNPNSVGTGSTYSVGSPGQYFATALVAGATAATPTITVGTLAPPTIAASVSGLPGASVVLRGTNFQVVTGVSFGSLPATFVLNSSTQLTATVPAGATSGDVLLTTGCTTVLRANGFSVSAPTITSFTPSSGLTNTSVVLTGTGFVAGATTVYFLGLNNTRVSALSTTVTSDTQLTAVVPASATGNGSIASTGTLLVTTAGGNGFSQNLFTASTGQAYVIASTTTLNANSFNSFPFPITDLVIAAPGNVTIIGGSLSSDPTLGLFVSSRIEVQAGATLNIVGNARVAGNGTFLLAAGATLNTGHPSGLNTGAAVAFSRRLFSPDASYGYTSTTPQITGNGLPSQVRNLTSRNADSLKLTRPVAVAQVLTMAGPGNFYLNNQPLTLLSGADGTALVHNQGTGVVVGTATVQRYINPTVNPTAGFRYYGSPVRGARAAVFGVPTFAYDQARSLAFVRQDTLPDISVGFVPTPLAASAFLEVGRGYRAAVAATDTVRFAGTLTTGNDTVNLLRSSRKAYSGWNLVSNPYPSPLNWNKVDPADRPGLEAAIYVYESTGPGKGYFRSYVYKKLGTGDSLIAAGQAFFVRVRQNPGTQTSTGRLIFRNSQRVTEFDPQTQPIFNRTALAAALEPRLDIEFERNGGCKPCGRTSTATAQTGQTGQVLSRVTVYTDSAATANFDPLLDADAGNLINLNQQTLGIRTGGSTRTSAATDTLALLAVQAVRPFSPARVTKVPLVLGATAPGLYTLGGTGQNLPALLNGTSAYLRDSSATTNNWITLPTATPYTFVLSAAELLTKAKTVRFWLHFGPAPVVPVPLATAGSAALQSATVYPNPAHEQFSVWVPAVAGATVVQATLLSALGQVVQQQAAALPAAGTTLHLAMQGQASGIYLLRLQAGSSIATRRIVLE